MAEVSEEDYLSLKSENEELKSKIKKMEKKVKVKTPKDPNAPKKPSSAYMMFAKESRGQLVVDNPHASFGEIGKLMGAQWKSLGEEQKSAWQLKAVADKERYKVAMEEYKKS